MVVYIASIVVQVSALFVFVAIGLRREFRPTTLTLGALFMFGMAERRATALMVGEFELNMLRGMDMRWLPLCISLLLLGFVISLGRESHDRRNGNAGGGGRRSRTMPCEECPVRVFGKGVKK